MPLKLCLFGNTLSGRHTQALKLTQKYGINVIDLNDVIKEALTLANPPI
jgi:adenylate kinase family enzyme